MNEKQLRSELNGDLQSASANKVIYLEGKTDAPIFFALLGLPEPRDGLHQGVLVKPLHEAPVTSARAMGKLASSRGSRNT